MKLSTPRDAAPRNPLQVLETISHALNRHDQVILEKGTQEAAAINAAFQTLRQFITQE